MQDTPRTTRYTTVLHNSEDDFCAYNARIKHIDDLLQHQTQAQLVAAAYFDNTLAKSQKITRKQYMAYEDRGQLEQYEEGREYVWNKVSGFSKLYSNTNRDGEICKFISQRNILRYSTKLPNDTRYPAYNRKQQVKFTINDKSPQMANLRNNLTDFMSDEDKHMVNEYLEKMCLLTFNHNTYLKFSINEWELLTPYDTPSVIPYTSASQLKAIPKIYSISRCAETSKYLANICGTLDFNCSARSMLERYLCSQNTNLMVTYLNQTGTVLADVPTSQLFQIPPIHLKKKRKKEGGGWV